MVLFFSPLQYCLPWFDRNQERSSQPQLPSWLGHEIFAQRLNNQHLVLNFIAPSTDLNEMFTWKPSLLVQSLIHQNHLISSFILLPSGESPHGTNSPSPSDGLNLSEDTSSNSSTNNASVLTCWISKDLDCDISSNISINTSLFIATRTWALVSSKPPAT